MKIKFTAFEPIVGEFETDEEMTLKEIIKEIEQQFPTYTDIEIV